MAYWKSSPGYDTDWISLSSWAHSLKDWQLTMEILQSILKVTTSQDNQLFFIIS